MCRYLAAHKRRWCGTALLVGQPAEETVAGAASLLEAGLYTRFPKPSLALALHCVEDRPAGAIVVWPAKAHASATSVTVTIRGVGGHGARPHKTVDPVVVAAEAVVLLQSIVSREVDPRQPAVLTVGSIHGGTKHNVIPDEVALQISIRSFSEPVRQQILAAIARRLNGLANAHVRTGAEHRGGAICATVVE